MYFKLILAQWSDFYKQDTPTNKFFDKTNQQFSLVSDTTAENVYIRDCKFYNLHSPDCGGAVNFLSAQNSIFLAENCYFAGCSSDLNGGALYVKVQGSTILSKLIFNSCNSTKPGQFLRTFTSDTNENSRNEYYKLTFINDNYPDKRISVAQTSGKIINKELNFSTCTLQKTSGIQCWPSYTAKNEYLNFENLTSDYSVTFLSDDSAKNFEMTFSYSNFIRNKPLSAVGQYSNYGIILLEGKASFLHCSFINNLDNLFYQKSSKDLDGVAECTSTVTNCNIVGGRTFGASEGCSVAFDLITAESSTKKINGFRTTESMPKYDDPTTPKCLMTCNILNPFLYLPFQRIFLNIE